MHTMDITHALQIACQQLKSSSDSPRLDAEVLLIHCLQRSRSFLYAYPDYILNTQEQTAYEAMIRQRQSGMPVAYLMGTREFWSLSLEVNSSTLIPRPETERLVELALELVARQMNAYILDLGTGTGAIALALAKERPHWSLLACDIESKAVALASRNAKKLGLKNVEIRCSDWFSAIPETGFHAIVSNPPYIEAQDPHLFQGDLRFEPHTALVSGKTGLDALQHLIHSSVHHLAPGGLLLLEHGYQQQQAVQNELSLAGFKNVQSWQDIQGHERISGGWYGADKAHKS